MAFVLLLLTLVFGGKICVGDATLPANVGQYAHIPNDQVSSVSIPLLFTNTTINPTDPSILQCTFSRHDRR